jgi:hypothetical protein
MKPKPISLSTKMFVDEGGNLVILETEFQKWCKQIKPFRVGIVVYVALTVGFSMYPVYLYLIQKVGFLANSPTSLRLGIYLVLLLKFCQLFFFAIHHLSQEMSMEDIRKQVKHKRHHGNNH